MIAWAYVMQDFGRGTPWDAAAFARARRDVDPAHYPVGMSAAGAALRLIPLLALYATTAEGPDAFNAALRAALVSHRTYYATPSFDPDPPEYQQNNPTGFIALGLLALAVAMADRSWLITVESDYLPRRLIHGAVTASPREWLGEDERCVRPPTKPDRYKRSRPRRGPRC